MCRRFFVCMACLGGLVASTAARAKITFDIDYSLDAANNNFFNPNTANGQAARAAMSAAAKVYEERLLDNLSLISPTPTGTNTWTAKFTNPGNGQLNYPVVDLTINANVMKVYVGGRTMSGELGSGGPGGISGSGTQTFVNTLLYRGQTGASTAVPSTDFGPWGGAISFEQNGNWNFSLTGPVAGKNDFLTVATHELAHVIGLGTAPSWKTRLTQSGFIQPGNTVPRYIGPFTGPKSVALYGGNVPLETVDTANNARHFNNGVSSTVGGVTPQETLMDPDITTGTRKRMTLLDWAALDDIGWDLARPGDANADGVVNFDDLVVVAQNYEVSPGNQTWSTGDFNYDGKTDFSDLVAVSQNYDLTGPQPGAALPGATGNDFAADWAAAQAVAAPEPGTLAVLLLPLAYAATRRRRD